MLRNRAPRRRPSVFCAVCRGLLVRARHRPLCVAPVILALVVCGSNSMFHTSLTRTTRPSTINPLVRRCGTQGQSEASEPQAVRGSVRATMTGTVEFGHNFLRLRVHPVRSYEWECKHVGPQLDTHCNAVISDMAPLRLHVDPITQYAIRPFPVPAPSHADLRLRTSNTAPRHETCFTCPNGPEGRRWR
jgi:hypothetical protein